MTTYAVEVETIGREVYVVDAENEEEAEALVMEGEAGKPEVSEVLELGPVTSVTDRTPSLGDRAFDRAKEAREYREGGL